jgi:dTDP-4-dehydrorhamnose reductase
VSSALPEYIDTLDQLNDTMTRPGPALTRFIRSVQSPLVILGAGGKMGPTLAVLARRAADAAGHDLDVVAVSRFSDRAAREWLEAQNVQTLSVDLFDQAALENLPDTPNVIYLVGLKFGTQQAPSLTWAANVLIPSYVMQRYQGARVVALSSGNVYPLVPVDGGGSQETDPLTPQGEYANSCVGRERVFEYFAQRDNTPVALIRLSYAVDLRYGVLVDIARRVYEGQSIDVTMGYLPYIWQGDANDRIIRALALADVPAVAINLTNPQPLKVRDVAQQFGAIMNKPVHVVGQEANTAFVSNIERLRSTLGAPDVPLSHLIRWTAHWVQHERPVFNKPTHFEVRDGTY